MKSIVNTIFVLGGFLWEQAQAQNIKIAVVSPLTIAPGQAIKRGTELALKQRRLEFKKLGIHLSLLAYDDQASPKKGKFISKQILQDPHILGVIGALNSSVSYVLAKEFSKSQLPLISPTSTNDALTSYGWTHFSRVVAPNRAQGFAAAQYISERIKAKRIFIISDNTTYGNGLCKTLIAALKDISTYPIKIIAYQGASSPHQYQLTLQYIQKKKPDLIYYGGTEKVGAELIQAIRQAKINTPIMGGDGLDNADFKTKIGSHANQVYFTTVYGPVHSFKSSHMFKLLYRKLYKEDPTGISVFSFDATNALLDVIKTTFTKNKSNFNRSYISAALKEFNKPECTRGKCQNVTGKLSFTKTGERQHSRVMVMKYDQHLRIRTLMYQYVQIQDLHTFQK